MAEQILNNVYAFLYAMYNGTHDNVDTDGKNIWVDLNGETYSVTVIKCEKVNDND